MPSDHELPAGAPAAAARSTVDSVDSRTGDVVLADLYARLSTKGQPAGVAPLDASGRLTAAQADPTVGPVGPQGPLGPQGPPGDKGAAGGKGPAGALGPAGTLPGSSGPDGDAGPQGAQGPEGPQGPQGAAGMPPMTGVGFHTPPPGRWVSAVSGAADAATVALNTMYAFAVQANDGGRFDAIGYYLGTTGAATSSLRWGIYTAAPGTFYPADLITELGNPANGTPSSRVLTFASLPLSAGVYWMAVAVQGSGTVPTLATCNAISPYVFFPAPATISATYWSLYTYSGITGALPASLTGVSRSSVADHAPRLHLRAA
jgi:hypothetical protein